MSNDGWVNIIKWEKQLNPLIKAKITNEWDNFKVSIFASNLIWEKKDFPTLTAAQNGVEEWWDNFKKENK